MRRSSHAIQFMNSQDIMKFTVTVSRGRSTLHPGICQPLDQTEAS